MSDVIQQATCLPLYLEDAADQNTVQQWVDDAVAEIASLRLKLSASVQESAGWQDMGSAPKDGTRILLRVRSEHKPAVVIGYWGVIASFWFVRGMTPLEYEAPDAWIPLPSPDAAPRYEAPQSEAIAYADEKGEVLVPEGSPLKAMMEALPNPAFGRKLLPLYAVSPAPNPDAVEALRVAAGAVLASWDARMGSEREEQREFEGHKYWAPHSSMVDSEDIAALRSALRALLPGDVA